MINQFTFNPLSGKFDEVSAIPELSLDPVSPNAGDAWVLKTQSGSGSIGGGKPRGLLLGLTIPGSGGSITFSYKFSYRTSEGSTVRTALA